MVLTFLVPPDLTQKHFPPALLRIRHFNFVNVPNFFSLLQLFGSRKFGSNVVMRDTLWTRSSVLRGLVESGGAHAKDASKSCTILTAIPTSSRVCKWTCRRRVDFPASAAFMALCGVEGLHKSLITQFCLLYAFHFCNTSIGKNSPSCIKIVGVLTLQYSVCDDLLIRTCDNLGRLSY